MSRWLQDVLDRIAATDDLHVSPFRENGITYGTPTWIWSVVVDGSLYVRAYHGQRSRWYRAAVAQGSGRIIAAGMDLDVAFVPVSSTSGDGIDDAYQAKYSGSPYLSAMISERARAATVRVDPR